MGDVGGSLIDQFEQFGFQHKAQKFLVRLSLRYDGFAVEAIVKEDFVWWQVCETCVTKDQPVVHIPDVANEKVVVGEDLFEVDGPNLFTNGNDHEAKGWRQRTAHGATSALADTFLAKSKCLHVQCRSYQAWDVLDDDLTCHSEASKCPALDDVPRIVGFPRIDRECLVVRDIPVWTKKVQQHKPGSDKPFLIDAGEESCQALVYQN